MRTLIVALIFTMSSCYSNKHFDMEIGNYLALIVILVMMSYLILVMGVIWLLEKTFKKKKINGLHSNKKSGIEKAP